MQVLCMDCKRLIREVPGEGVSHGLCRLHYTIRMAPMYLHLWWREVIVGIILVGVLALAILA